MKRTLSIIICILLLAGCLCVAAEEDPGFGTYSGNVYVNEVAGFTFTLPEEWTFVSRETLEQSMGILGALSDSEAFRQAMEAGTQFTVMSAAGANGSAVNLAAVPMDAASFAGIKTLGEGVLLEAIRPSVLQSYEAMNMKVSSCEIVSLNIGGTEKECLHLDMVAFGLTMEAVQFFQAREGCLYVVTVMGMGGAAPALECISLSE